MNREDIVRMLRKADMTSEYENRMPDLSLDCLPFFERFANLIIEERTKQLMQIFTDPENQPSQYGTVTIEYMDERIQEIISGKRKWHLTATDVERIAFDAVCDGVAQKIREMKC